MAVFVSVAALATLSTVANAHSAPAQTETWNVVTGVTSKVDTDSTYFFGEDHYMTMGATDALGYRQMISGSGYLLWDGATYTVRSSNTNVVRVGDIVCAECNPERLVETVTEGVEVNGVGVGTATVYLDRTYKGVTKTVDSIKVVVSYIPASFRPVKHELDGTFGDVRLYDVADRPERFYYNPFTDTGLGEQLVGTIDSFSTQSKYSFSIDNGGKMYLGKNADGSLNDQVYINTDKVGTYNCKITEVNYKGETKVLAQFKITTHLPEYSVKDVTYRMSNPMTFSSTGILTGIDSSLMGNVIKYQDNRYNYYTNSSAPYYLTHMSLGRISVYDMLGNEQTSVTVNAVDREKRAIYTIDGGLHNPGTMTIDVYRQPKAGGPIQKVHSYTVTVVE